MMKKSENKKPYGVIIEKKKYKLKKEKVYKYFFDKVLGFLCIDKGEDLFWLKEMQVYSIIDTEIQVENIFKNTHKITINKL
ncbi:hypothetical protein [Elizabethkingia anophelis]|uniref:hypothetical protein n=1 Tax=Elizabethkingia anophelis TaxID=1117645 RepID=UPI00301DE2DC